MTLIADAFPEIPAPKNMVKYLKSPVSEDPWTDNTANEWKYCSNLNFSPFTIFINHCAGSCIGKSFF